MWLFLGPRADFFRAMTCLGRSPLLINHQKDSILHPFLLYLRCPFLSQILRVVIELFSRISSPLRFASLFSWTYHSSLLVPVQMHFNFCISNSLHSNSEVVWHYKLPWPPTLSRGASHSPYCSLPLFYSYHRNGISLFRCWTYRAPELDINHFCVAIT